MVFNSDGGHELVSVLWKPLYSSRIKLQKVKTFKRSSLPSYDEASEFTSSIETSRNTRRVRCEQAI